MGINDEHNEQANLIAWCNMYESRVPDLALIYAIPSGGHRRKSVAGRMKAEGVKAGLPDLHLPVPMTRREDGRIFHGLWIEMKVPGGRVRATQKWWHEALRNMGHRVEVCWSFEEARNVLLDYLEYKIEIDEYLGEKITPKYI
jgi:hypothetical protein